MKVTRLTIQDLRALPMVASASEWRDRIYVTLRGNGGNFAGERHSKVWLSPKGDLVVERGKGMTSREWDAQVIFSRRSTVPGSQSKDCCWSDPGAQQTTSGENQIGAMRSKLGSGWKPRRENIADFGGLK